MAPDLNDQNTLSIDAAPLGPLAFVPGTPYNWGVINVPFDSVPGLYQQNWTSETTMSVTANTPYTMTLFVRREFGTSKTDCSGSFSVRVY